MDVTKAEWCSEMMTLVQVSVSTLVQVSEYIGTGAVRQKMHYNVWWAAGDNNDLEMQVMLLMDAGDAEVEEEELDGVVDQSTEHEFSFKEFVMRWEFTFFFFLHP